jgi:hypothetical protein
MSPGFASRRTLWDPPYPWGNEPHCTQMETPLRHVRLTTEAKVVSTPRRANLDGDMVGETLESAFAYAAHLTKLTDRRERSVLLTPCNYPLGDDGTDSG